jgi:hypothetical protein
MDSRGAGWVLFAGIMLFLAGILKFFDAIWAFSYHGVLPANLEGAIFGHSLKTYGWVDLVVAVILVVCAGAVFASKAFGRWVGIFAAAIAAISAIWWMPFCPVWAFTYMVIAASMHPLRGTRPRCAHSRPGAVRRALDGILS